MHYLASLSHKLVTAYQNQENALTSTGHEQGTDKMDTRMLVEAVQAVLEQEIECGRLRYDLLHTHRLENLFQEQSQPYFEEILFHRG
jgi:hypothetical protein